MRARITSSRNEEANAEHLHGFCHAGRKPALAHAAAQTNLANSARTSGSSLFICIYDYRLAAGDGKKEEEVSRVELRGRRNLAVCAGGTYFRS